MRDRWYDSTAAQVVEKLNTNASTGLSRKEAAKRLREHGTNVIYPVEKAPLKKYILHIVTDLLSILLLITAVLAAIFEEETGAVVILAILVLSKIIAVFAYVKSQRVLEEMGNYAIPSAKVIREGKLFLIKQEKLVPGDVIVLSAGDIVPADARIIDDDDLFVLETGICKSNDPTKKSAEFIDHRNLKPDDRANMVFASTLVSRGKGRAVVVETGEDALVCTMGKNTTIAAHGQLRVMAKIEKYCSQWSLVSIAMIFILTILNLCVGRREGLFEVFLSSLSLAVSAMAELIGAFAYVVLACGIFSAVRQYRSVNSGALIKNSTKIEDIKDIDCLIIHRDCIFSERDMEVAGVFADGDLRQLNDRRPYEATLRTLKYGLISTGLYGAGNLVANNERNENVYTPEEEAIISAASRMGMYNKNLDADYPILAHATVGGASCFETTLVFDKGEYLVAVRGDPGQILDRCTCTTENGRVVALDANKKNELLISASRLIRSNYKVVAVATRNTVYNTLRRIGAVQNDLVFEGFICITEPLLPEAAKNISRCRAAGIRIIMFCDKHEENNIPLAIGTGIAKNASECVDISTLRSMSADLVRTNLPLYSMYEGLSTTQKRYIIRWLKEDHGYKVGVLGRELDDISLFREADVGFTEVVTISGHANSSGVDLLSRDAPVYVRSSRDSAKSGCEGLKFISDVIVSKAEKNGNGGFNSIVGSIVTSKNIYLNLLHMIRYLLVSQLARFFIVLWCAFTAEAMLTSVQIVFLGLIVDLLGVITIAFMRPGADVIRMKDNIEEKLTLLPRKNISTISFALIWAALVFNAAWLSQKFSINLSPEGVPAFAFLAYLLTSVVVLAEISLERSIFSQDLHISTSFMLMLIFIALVIMFSLLFPSFGALIGIVPIPARAWLWILIPPAAMLIIFELYKLFSKPKEKKAK